MQPLKLDEYNNRMEWEVVHDPSSQLYYLKNSRGNTKPGRYTSRRMAMKALQDYLDRIKVEYKKVADRKNGNK